MSEPVCSCDGNGWIVCLGCHGEGGRHACGEDCCTCLDQEEITEICDECDGAGGFSCPVCALHAEEFIE